MNQSCLNLKSEIYNQRVDVFSQGGDGVHCYQGRLCVPNVGDLIKYILAEAHNSRYSTNPGATKICRDLHEVYWLNGTKKNIIDFVVPKLLASQGQTSETMRYDSRDKYSYLDVGCYKYAFHKSTTSYSQTT